jgi:hypothetical protein
VLLADVTCSAICSTSTGELHNRFPPPHAPALLGIDNLLRALRATAAVTRPRTVRRIARSQLAVFFGPPQELINDKQVHVQLGSGGSRDDQNRVFTGRHLEPEAAQLTPNSTTWGAAIKTAAVSCKLAPATALVL